MCRGRLCRSGSVVYSSRTNPRNALPPSRSSLKPRTPETASTMPAAVDFEARRRARRDRPARTPRSRRDGEYGISDAEICSPSTCAYVARNFSPRNRQYSSRSYPVEIHRLALDEILHRIGGDEAAVVAFGVGLPERVAVEQQQHVGAEHRAAAFRRSCRRG